MKTFSLTRRLITVVLLVQSCTTTLLIAGAGIYNATSQFRAFDIMLRGRADSLLGAVQDSEDANDNVMLDGTQSLFPKRDIYAVQDEFGRNLGHSGNWTTPDGSFADDREFRSLKIGNKEYRIIRVSGLRMVDPGDKGGGVPRHVVILYGVRTNPVWESIENSILFYAVLGVVLLGVNGLLMLRLMRRGLRPLRELAAQAGRVSVDSWHFDTPDHVLEVEELAPLVAALRTALAGLERSFDQQRHFISNAAHELKTSVAVVKSSLQVLSLKERDPAEYRVGLERVEFDCERMEELVTSMLLLARLESQSGTLIAAADIDLNDLVLEVVEHLRTAAELANVQVAVYAEQPVWIAGEREQLRLLCSNLVHNAIQHSSNAGEVRVRLRRQKTIASLVIEDDGEGISAEALPHVFERFYRADASRSRRTGGTGLGLAIAKAVVLSMNGEIQIASDLGRGTCVTVTLPAIHHPDTLEYR